MTNREMIEKAIKVCATNKSLFKDIGVISFSKVCDETNKAYYAMKLKEDYGIPDVTVDMIRSAEPNVYVSINDVTCIMSMGEKYRRTISWSADGQQPQDEVMLVLTFPTGPYVFGGDYPAELFKEMWEEIKTYDFKYVDDVNREIYFPLDKAAPIANAFRGIYKRYFERYRKEASARRAEELRRELQELESTAETSRDIEA